MIEHAHDLVTPEHWPTVVEALSTPTRDLLMVQENSLYREWTTTLRSQFPSFESSHLSLAVGFACHLAEREGASVSALVVYSDAFVDRFVADWRALGHYAESAPAHDLPRSALIAHPTLPDRRIEVYAFPPLYEGFWSDSARNTLFALAMTQRFDAESLSEVWVEDGDGRPMLATASAARAQSTFPIPRSWTNAPPDEPKHTLPQTPALYEALGLAKDEDGCYFNISTTIKLVDSQGVVLHPAHPATLSVHGTEFKDPANNEHLHRLLLNSAKDLPYFLPLSARVKDDRDLGMQATVHALCFTLYNARQIDPDLLLLPSQEAYDALGQECYASLSSLPYGGPRNTLGQFPLGEVLINPVTGGTIEVRVVKTGAPYAVLLTTRLPATAPYNTPLFLGDVTGRVIPVLDGTATGFALRSGTELREPSPSNPLIPWLTFLNAHDALAATLKEITEKLISASQTPTNWLFPPTSPRSNERYWDEECFTFDRTWRSSYVTFEGFGTPRRPSSYFRMGPRRVDGAFEVSSLIESPELQAREFEEKVAFIAPLPAPARRRTPLSVVWAPSAAMTLPRLEPALLCTCGAVIREGVRDAAMPESGACRLYTGRPCPEPEEMIDDGF